MRRQYIFFFLVFFSILITTKSIGQQIKGALIGGFNLSQVDGDAAFGFNKFGLNMGAAALVPFGEHFYFSLETVYSQKGSYQGPSYSDKDSTGFERTGEYKLQLNYLEVPFLVLYNDKDIITAGAGLSYGRLVSVNEYEHGQLVESTNLNEGPYDRNDFNILADVRFRVYKKLKFNFRYAYSLAKIRTRDFYDLRGIYTNTRKQYNNVLTFRLIYMFNEKPPLADDKNRDAGF